MERVLVEQSDDANRLHVVCKQTNHPAIGGVLVTARWLEWLGTRGSNLRYAGSIPVLASGGGSVMAETGRPRTI